MAPADLPAPPSGRDRLTGLARAARPRQWLKNVLVVAAPAMAGQLTVGSALLDTGIAFGAFCLASSGTYLINDARDATADRGHADKRHRPVAAGTISAPVAYLAGGGALAASLTVATLAGTALLALTVLGYFALTTAYTVWLRHVAVVDLMAVAGGFVLRALAGAAAVSVPVSSWFLIVASLGSLFVVAGKREAELRAAHGGPTRATLARYSREFLAYVRSATTGAVLVAYCLWVSEHPESVGRLVFGLAAIPLTVGMLRYALLVDRGFGEAPEDVLLRDRLLVVAGLLVVGGLGVGVYAV